MQTLTPLTRQGEKMADEKQRQVLAIDDNQTNLALLQVYMKQIGVKALLATGAIQGIEIAIEQKPDLILLDIMMPEVDGFECCERLKSDSRTAHIPIIFISAKGQASDKVDGLKRGAMDYISKPFDPAELRARIGIALQMISLQEKLLNQANTDELTGLANRRHFFDAFERQLSQSKEQKSNIAVIMFDFDHFKHINDTYGHQGGDMALKQLANILKDNVGPDDIAARYGGEEFVIMMPDADIGQAFEKAEKIRSIISAEKWDVAGTMVNITASLGVSSTSISQDYDTHELLMQADSGLYAAKGRGRNRVVCYNDLDESEQLQAQASEEVEQLQGKVSELADSLQQQARDMVAAFSQALYAKDPLTQNHANNVALYAKALATELKLDGEFIRSLETAALLHDLGKISVPGDILQKDGGLDDRESEIVRKHPEVSVEILSPAKIFEKELPCIKHHHENYDGSGYPDGLAGEQIPFGARILRIVDMYEALTSDRWHRQALSNEEALKIIHDGFGKEFDPELAETFCQIVKQSNLQDLAQTLQQAVS